MKIGNTSLNEYWEGDSHVFEKYQLTYTENLSQALHSMKSVDLYLKSTSKRNGWSIKIRLTLSNAIKTGSMKFQNPTNKNNLSPNQNQLQELFSQSYNNRKPLKLLKPKLVSSISIFLPPPQIIAVHQSNRLSQYSPNSQQLLFMKKMNFLTLLRLGRQYLKETKLTAI